MKNIKVINEKKNDTTTKFNFFYPLSSIILVNKQPHSVGLDNSYVMILIVIHQN